MPVLATTYRVPLSGFRNPDGSALAIDGAQTSANWGLHLGRNYEYLVGGDGDLVSGFVQFLMPANYIPGSAFSVSVGVLDDQNSTGDELTVKSVQLQAANLAENTWDDASGEVIALTAQDISSGSYTVYTFTSAGAADIASLSPGDLISIRVVANWPEFAAPSLPLLVNMFVNIDPA